MDEKLKKLIDDIKSLKIQGATNVCLSVLKFISENKDNISTSDLKKLYYVRLTEPMLRNCLDLYKDGVDVNYLIKIVEKSKEWISDIGKNIFPKRCMVMTHCHSSTTTKSIIKAHKEGKQILVYVTETRPKNQGLLTAKELLNSGVPIRYIVDNAAHFYLHRCWAFVFGGDAILYNGGVINKIGTAMMAISAKRYHGNKVYSFCSILKYDPKTEQSGHEYIEFRDPKEVSEEIPSEVIRNPAFGLIDPELIDGIVTEVGIISPYQAKYEFDYYIELIKDGRILVD